MSKLLKSLVVLAVALTAIYLASQLLRGDTSPVTTVLAIGILVCAAIDCVMIFVLALGWVTRTLFDWINK